MKDFKKFIIDQNTKCIEVLKIIDIGDTNQTLFAVNKFGTLIGTVTDGDIRRGLIRGKSLTDKIKEFINLDFVHLGEGIDTRVLRKWKDQGIKVIPKLDKNGKIVTIYDLSLKQSILPIHAFIMAGGRGERLKPLTDTIPKPMLPLGEKPIIEHNIDRLISYGIEEITVSVRYLGDQIKEYFRNGEDKGIKINYIEENYPLGTIGCLGLADTFSQNYILVMNSDLFTNINLEGFFMEFLDKKSDMSVASIPYSVHIPYAIMNLDDDKVLDFQEKPKNTYYANAGIYLLKTEVLDYIPKDTFFNATDLMDEVIQKGKLVHYPISGYWIDIGNHEDYRRAQEIVKHINNF